MRICGVKIKQVKIVVIGHSLRNRYQGGMVLREEAARMVCTDPSREWSWFATIYIAWRVLTVKGRNGGTKECSSTENFP